MWGDTNPTTLNGLGTPNPRPQPRSWGVPFPRTRSFPRQSVNSRSAKLFTASGHTARSEPEPHKSTQESSYSVLGAATASWIIVGAVAGMKEPLPIPRAPAGAELARSSVHWLCAATRVCLSHSFGKTGVRSCDDVKSSPPQQEKGPGSALLPTQGAPLFKDQP